MMKNSGGNPAIVVVLILVIAIAAAFIVKVSTTKRYGRPVVDWTCEECGHRFVDEVQRDPRACPECRGEAVRTLYYYCSLHDHIFAAYRSKLDPDLDPEKMMGPGRGMLYKYELSGGEWTKDYPPEIACPLGNSALKTVKYCPPGADERQEQTP